MKTILAISIFLAILVGEVPVWGHGTEGITQVAKGILASAGYDDGEPMSYAAVEIIGPDSSTPFQKGRTDRNGMFMFLPDQSGNWKIVVKDQIGHRLVLEMEVTKTNRDTFQTESRREDGPAVSRLGGILAGISIIFGLCGLAYGWKARHR